MTQLTEPIDLDELEEDADEYYLLDVYTVPMLDNAEPLDEELRKLDDLLARFEVPDA